jgi:stringent starvation protein B
VNHRALNAQAYSACLAETASCPTGVETFVVPSRTTGLPPHLRSEQLVRLQIGLNMPQPIHDLHVGVESVSGTLRFSGQPHFVVIPWHAIVWYGTLAELEAERAQERASAGARRAPKAKPEAPLAATNVVRVDFKARRRA